MTTAPTQRRHLGRAGQAVLASLLLASGMTTAPAPASAVSAVSVVTATTPTVDQEPRYPVVPFRPRGNDDARLIKAWNAWQGRGHQQYTTVVGRFCGCQPEPRVSTQVEGDQVRSVTYLHGDEEIERHGYEMDELFRIIRAAQAEADDVKVKYLSGVPVSIQITYGPRRSDRDTNMAARVRRIDEAAVFAYAIAPFRLRADDEEELRASWLAWRAAAIAAYDVTAVRRGRGRFAAVRTTVEGGVVRTVEAVGVGSAPKRGYEVEQVYRMLRTLHRTADSVSVRYDERGVPRRISADPDADTAGDEFVMRVRLRGA